MDDRNGYIEVEGLSEVSKALAAADKNVCAAALVGLQEAAMNIVGDAKDNLERDGGVVTGLLRSSGNAWRKGDEVVAGFFDTTNSSSGYALYHEFGRRSGKMPPPDILAAWAYKKYHMKDWKAARSLGWAWAKAIARKGTRPHPFFVPAVNKNTKGGGLGSVENSVTKEVARVLRGNTARMALRAREIRNTPNV
jgi:hypothetical protein